MKYSAIYARSSLGRERQGETIEHQIAMIQEFAERQDLHSNFSDKFIYEDEDSGFKTTLLQRPAMKQLLSDIENDLIDTVYFKGISRFARDSSETITTSKRLHNKGVRVISLEENFDSYRDDPTMFQIYAVMAEQESRKTGIRVSLGNKQKARRGLWSNASTPCGYTRVKDLTDRELKERLIGEENRHPQTLYPDERAIIPKKAFDLFVNQGWGRKRIASYLNDQGYRTQKGAYISDKYIKDMLANEAYIGNVTYGKSRYEFIENENSSRKTQKTIKVDRSNWAIAESVHPPIIDRELFDKAQVLIKSKENSFNFGKRFNAAKHPLTGLLKCGKCGAGMICQKRSNKMKDGTKKEYRYYVCTTYHKMGRDVCSQANINADKIEKSVMEFVKERVINEIKSIDIDKGVEKAKTKKDEYEGEIKMLNKNIEKKVNGVKKLMESIDVYDSETFNELNKNLNDDIKKLRQQKEKLQNQLKNEEDESKVFNAKILLDRFLNEGINDVKELREFFSGTIMRVEAEDRSVKKIVTIPFS